MRQFILSLTVATTILLTGCATKHEKLLEKRILTPENVEVYDLSLEHIWPKRTYGRELLKDFPFVSNEPVIDFKGKFSDQFYEKIDYRYKFSPLRDVDFWKLRTNPFLVDFIYVLPMWANNFIRVSNDLFENICYSKNLSKKEQEILKWWISEGGILWIEGGIYSTRYDTFKKNGEIDQEAINTKLINKSKNLHFFDRSVKTYIYKSKKVDFINYEPLTLKFKTKSDKNYFHDIKNLKIVTKNYLSVDFIPKGNYLLYSKKNRPLVSFISYGKGAVIFLRPFEFQDKRYDGELLRWKLIYYLLNRMYVKKEKILKKPQKTFTLRNLHFAYKSYQLKPQSFELLQPIVTYLKDNPNTKVVVIGHTDSIGSRNYNYDLSLNRAKAVRNALIKMGISKERIEVKGYGEDMPIASNKTEEGRALNRRVEFIIIKRNINNEKSR